MSFLRTGRFEARGNGLLVPRQISTRNPSCVRASYSSDILCSRRYQRVKVDMEETYTVNKILVEDDEHNQNTPLAVALSSQRDTLHISSILCVYSISRAFLLPSQGVVGMHRQTW